MPWLDCVRLRPQTKEAVELQSAHRIFTAMTAMIAKTVAMDIALLTHRTIAGVHRGSSTQVC